MKKINYRELSYLLGMKTKESKAIISKLLDKEISIKDEIDIDKLDEEFPKTRSVDDRYHNKGLVSEKIKQLKFTFRNYLSDKDCVKKIQFIGGKSVYKKFLDEPDYDFAIERLAFNHQFLYGKETEVYKKYADKKEKRT